MTGAKLTIEVDDEDDMEDAVEHVLDLIRQDYTSGRDSGLYWSISKVY